MKSFENFDHLGIFRCALSKHSIHACFQHFSLPSKMLPPRPGSKPHFPGQKPSTVNTVLPRWFVPCTEIFSCRTLLPNIGVNSCNLCPSIEVRYIRSCTARRIALNFWLSLNALRAYVDITVYTHIYPATTFTRILPLPTNVALRRLVLGKRHDSCLLSALRCRAISFGEWRWMIGDAIQDKSNSATFVRIL